MAGACAGPGCSRELIARAYREACAVELAALKPGNVHQYADGHGMCLADFIMSAQASALIGFGQGATLALHSTLLNTPWADRVVALAGAFAQRPESVRYLGTIHLLHGKDDARTHWKTVLEDAYCLRDRGVDMTAEIMPLIGHALHASLIDKTLERLSTHISKHLFEAAVASAPGSEQNKIQ